MKYDRFSWLANDVLVMSGWYFYTSSKLWEVTVTVEENIWAILKNASFLLNSLGQRNTYNSALISNKVCEFKIKNTHKCCDFLLCYEL